MTKKELINKIAVEGSDNPVATYVFGIPCYIYSSFKTRKGTTEQMVRIGSRGGAGRAVHIDQAAYQLLERRNDVTPEQRVRIEKWVASESTVFID